MESLNLAMLAGNTGCKLPGNQVLTGCIPENKQSRIHSAEWTVIYFGNAVLITRLYKTIFILENSKKRTLEPGNGYLCLNITEINCAG